MATLDTEGMTAARDGEARLLGPVLLVALMAGLYLTSLYNYLLFHSLAEIYSIVIAFSVFTIAWNARRYLDNAYLLTLGVSCLFIGFLDLLHTLSYTGMAIFTDYDFYANQLWIAARYMGSVTLLGAFAFVDRKKPDTGKLLAGYTAVTFLFVASIFWWKNFPVCFVEGKGQTPFKVYSEYAICTILLLALWVLRRKKDRFEPQIYRLVGLSILTTIVSELAFTIYISNYGISNLVGHYFKIFTFMLVYAAIVKTSLNDPYNVIFRELNLANEQLRKEVEARKLAEDQKEQVIAQLQGALKEIKTLKGIIPICSYCKNIRNDSGYWEQLEAFISTHSGADFSHGICPKCLEKHFPDFAEKYQKGDE